MLNLNYRELSLIAMALRVEIDAMSREASPYNESRLQELKELLEKIRSVGN